MKTIRPKYLAGAERTKAEQLVRYQEYEADLELMTNPVAAEKRLTTCRHLRQMLPPSSIVHNWPQGQRELLPLPEPSSDSN